MSESEREAVLTIDALITRRLADLDLSSVMLVERCGYANISKGLRRLASIRAGDLERASHILAALPKALEVSAAEVREAIEQTTAQLSAARERAWREAFRPHAIIRTERERPSQITIAIVCGFVSLRRIDFPDGMPALGYIGFTRSEIGARLARWRGGGSHLRKGDRLHHQLLAGFGRGFRSRGHGSPAARTGLRAWRRQLRIVRPRRAPPVWLRLRSIERRTSRMTPPNAEVWTSDTHPLRIAELDAPGGGKVGLTYCPGKHQDEALGCWRRDLNSDLDVIEKWGANVVLTLVEAHELESLNVPALGREVQARGVAWLHLPIVDNWIPDAAFEASWDDEARGLHEILDRGGRILVHCKGGVGRAGTIATRLLIERGASADEAIAAVRRARPGAVENTTQEGYLRRLRDPYDGKNVQ